MLSGAFNGDYSPITLYQGYLQGIVISSLYKSFSGIEWYTLYMMTLSIFSYGCLASIILYKVCDKYIRWCVFITLFIIQLYFQVSPQFTVIASELAISSFLVYIFGKKRLYVLLSLFLYVCAFEVRYDAAIMSIALMLPILLLYDKNLYTTLKNRYVFIIIALGITLILKTIDIVSVEFYDGFSEYEEYNKPRNYLGCNPGYNLCEDELSETERLELSQMYDVWVFDTEIFTKEKLNTYVESIKTRVFDIISLNIKPYFILFLKIGGIFIIPFYLLLIFVFIREGVNKNIYPTILLGLLIVIVNIYMMTYSFPKVRSLIPIILVSIAYFTFVVVFLNKKTLRGPFFILMLLLSLLYIKKINYARHWGQDNLKKIEEITNLLETHEANKILFFSLVPFQTEIYNSSNSLISKKIVLSDWITNSPYSLKYYRGYKSLCEGLPILINKGDEPYVDNIVKQLKSFYNTDVTLEVALESENFKIIELNKHNNE